MALDRTPSKASPNRTIKVRTVDPNRSYDLHIKMFLETKFYYFFRYVQNHCFSEILDHPKTVILYVIYKIVKKFQKI